MQNLALLVVTFAIALGVATALPPFHIRKKAALADIYGSDGETDKRAALPPFHVRSALPPFNLRSTPPEEYVGILTDSHSPICGNRDGRRMFVCPSSTLEDLRCLDISQLCDSVTDCAQNEDEELASCVLLGRYRRSLSSTDLKTEE